jgi:hypothetical protein
MMVYRKPIQPLDCRAIETDFDVLESSLYSGRQETVTTKKIFRTYGRIAAPPGIDIGNYRTAIAAEFEHLRRSMIGGTRQLESIRSGFSQLNVTVPNCETSRAAYRENLRPAIDRFEGYMGNAHQSVITIKRKIEDIRGFRRHLTAIEKGHLQEMYRLVMPSLNILDHLTETCYWSIIALKRLLNHSMQQSAERST